MQRMFSTHSVRRSVEIDGLWDFEADGKKTVMPVPACWETHPEFRNYRGKALYTKQVNLPAGNLLLTFKGVSHTATVFVDDTEVGQHYNAYTPFTLLVPNVSAGTHIVKVEVDNSFNEESALHIPNDYFTYGGIIRPVIEESVGDTYIERLECTPDIQEGSCKLKVRAYLTAVSEAVKKIKLAFTLNNRRYDFPETDVHENVVLEKEFDVDGVEPWSADSPTLYLVNAVLSRDGVIIDDLVERIAFRTVEICGREILVNGKPVFLQGFCRHEDHPLFGAAIPFQAQMYDLQLLRDLGSNIVRTTHYPNDELFLDLCDELGIYVWEESHARGHNEVQMKHPNFDKQSEDCIREMVRCHYNHPSIIIWGVLNECASYSDYGTACYEKQIAQIRSMDSSQPVTYASCHFMNDKCMHLADIVSYNIYSGWYEKRDTTEFLNSLVAWTDENGGVGKPYIISEFGAGGIYGFRDTRHVKWSEERQAEIIDENLTVYCHHEVVRGVIIWQFCDGLVADDNFYGRPKTRNNKGIVDEFRRPKLAYDVVKKHFVRAAK
ncbi:beta-glucuronidase [Clostridia bacterium]|nr:beta-glucuronidase [Clostridia bacterium]